MSPYLIIVIEFLEIALRYKIANDMVAQTDSIVEVTKPDRGVMVGDSSILLESQAAVNSFVIAISFIVIPKSSSQMGSDEADARV